MLTSTKLDCVCVCVCCLYQTYFSIATYHIKHPLSDSCPKWKEAKDMEGMRACSEYPLEICKMRWTRKREERCWQKWLFLWACQIRALVFNSTSLSSATLQSICVTLSLSLSLSSSLHWMCFCQLTALNRVSTEDPLYLHQLLQYRHAIRTGQVNKLDCSFTWQFVVA